MKQSRLYAVAYDISHDSRRVKVANVLKSFGERVQYSVFECWLEQRELTELQQRLQKILKPIEDSVRIYQIGPNVTLLGQGEVSADPSFFLV